MYTVCGGGGSYNSDCAEVPMVKKVPANGPCKEETSVHI